MGPPSSLKKEILKKWAMGLEMWSSSSCKEMSLLERKKAIKLSADIAMASARNGATFWSRALITNAAKDMIRSSKALIPMQPKTMKRQSAAVLPTERWTKFTPLPTLQVSIRRTARVVRRSKRILRKAQIRSNTQACCRKGEASLTTRKLVKKRTRVLKKLVPGGEYMDEPHLIKETLDYIIYLQAQVHVMQHVATATELFSSK